MIKECSYCKKIEPITKEHIFPDFIYRKLNLKNTNSQYLTYEIYTNKANKKELFIADVCQECNNEKLSELDDHISEITDTLLYSNGNELTVVYNYHLLQRWLLKTIFNATRLIKADSTSSIYKKYYSEYILTGKKTHTFPKTILLGFKMKNSRFSSSFMTIGMFSPFQNAFAEDLNIFDFFQIKSFVFIVVSFKNAKYFKKSSNKVIDYLKKEYGASIIQERGQFIFDDSKSDFQHIYLFNANEEGTSIPINLYCRLQWNLHENTPSLQQEISALMMNPVNANYFAKRFANKTEPIYANGKHLMVSSSEGPILVINKIEYIDINLLYIKDCSHEQLEDVEELKNASVKIKRIEDMTILVIYDQNDPNYPYLTNKTNQSLENWGLFDESIKKSNYYLYIALATSPNIQQQLQKQYFKELNFISKIKITEINNQIVV